MICIIPARGGSRRIPKKNIKDFCGKPIIAYSIQTALRSRLFDQIIVSTDSPEIWKVAEAWGADTIVNRSVYASQDKIGTQAVAREVLEQWVDPMPAQTCVLYATAPLLTINDLRKGYAMLGISKYTMSVDADGNDTGSFYWGWTEHFLDAVPLKGNSRYVQVNDIDINTESDWLKAEAVYEGRHG